MLVEQIYSHLAERQKAYDWSKLDIPNYYQWITTFSKVDEEHGTVISHLIIHSYVTNKLGHLSEEEKKREIEGLLNNRRKQGIYGLRVGEGGKGGKGLRLNFTQLPDDLRQILLVYLFEYISESGIPPGLLKQ